MRVKLENNDHFFDYFLCSEETKPLALIVKKHKPHKKRQKDES
jgi:hypothetical protein